MAKTNEYVENIRIKASIDTKDVEQSMRKIQSMVSSFTPTASPKVNSYVEKLAQQFQQLNSMNLNGISNATQLKEYESLIRSITKDMEKLGVTAASALNTSTSETTVALRAAKRELQSALQINAPGMAKNTLSDSFITELNKQTKLYVSGQQKSISYQDTLNKSLKSTIELMEKTAALSKDPSKYTAELDRLRNLSTYGTSENIDARRSAMHYSDSFGEDLKRQNNLEGMNQEIQNYVLLQQQLRNKVGEANASLNEQLGVQKRINEQFNRFQNYVGYMFSFASILTSIKRVIRETFNDVEQLDKAFGSIAMVTNYSVQDMWNSYDKYAEMANRLGQSTKDVIESSALFYQQGLKTADALSLTESTMKLATLAGSDFSTATSQMTAAIRGFNLEMEDSSHITDVYSELAANAAADVNGIAYALSKAAAIADSAGMSFENTAAFLAKMIESTQEAPENLGTALKTVIARFTELKTDVSGLTETELEGMDLNKVDTALKSVGVQLKKSNGEFRNLDDVFLELSSKWNTMSRNSQRYVATIAAGSRLNVNRLHLAA